MLISIQRRLLCPTREEGGFTLVELLVVITLLTVVGGIVTTSLVQAFRTSAAAQERIEALTELERAAQRITREARGAAPVTAATGDLLTVEVITDGARVRHSFQRSGDAIRHTITQVASGSTTTRPLIGDLASGATFSYLAADGNPPASAADVAKVVITLRRDLPRQDPIVISTSASLRNAD